MPEDYEMKHEERSSPSLMPRRKFFSAAAAATALGLIGTREGIARAERGSVGAAAPSRLRLFREVIMLNRVNVSVFEACLGQTFRAVGLEGTAYDLELSEAKALEPRPGLTHLGIREDPFSLMFKASAGAPLPQGSYTLEHARIAPFDLFLVPIGVRHPSQPATLQAVFG
jgi:hypothetical protein